MTLRPIPGQPDYVTIPEFPDEKTTVKSTRVSSTRKKSPQIVEQPAPILWEGDDSKAFWIRLYSAFGGGMSAPLICSYDGAKTGCELTIVFGDTDMVSEIFYIEKLLTFIQSRGRNDLFLSIANKLGVALKREQNLKVWLSWVDRQLEVSIQNKYYDYRWLIRSEDADLLARVIREKTPKGKAFDRNFGSGVRLHKEIDDRIYRRR